MSDNTKDIDTKPVVEAAIVEEVAPKADVKAAPAVDADATVDYWANAWANRGA
jgi:hypothetical protein